MSTCPWKIWVFSLIQGIFPWLWDLFGPILQRHLASLSVSAVVVWELVQVWGLDSGLLFYLVSWSTSCWFILDLCWLYIKQYSWWPLIHPSSRVMLYESSPWRLRWSRTHLQCRRPKFDPWIGKIPWRRRWKSTPVFLPEKSHGQRSLAGYSPWGHKESDTTEWLTLWAASIILWVRSSLGSH